MFEVLKLFVEYVTKVLPVIKGSSEERESARIGAALFDFFVAANEMVRTGDHIVYLLRMYVRTMQRHLVTGDCPRALEAGHELYYYVRRQGEALDLLGGELLALRPFLSMVLSASEMRDLEDLFDYKSGSILALQGRMAQGELVIDRTASQRGSLHEFTSSAVFNPVIIPTNVPWEREILEAVRDYLFVRRPDQQLSEIAELLETLRTAIMQNFELRDVMLEVAKLRPAFEP